MQLLLLPFMMLFGVMMGLGAMFVGAIIGPLVGMLAGYIVGHVTFLAGPVTEGLSTLGFHVSPAGLVPLGGALGFVGGYFRAIQSNSNS